MIETEKLILRPITQADFSTWYAILSDAETMQHYPKPFDEAKTQSWIDWTLDNYAKYGFGLWAVTLKETGEMIGDCGITLQNIHGDGVMLPEVGFHISKAHWRKGYASAAARAVLDWMFANTDYDEAFCYQKYTNVGSRKTAQSIGMTLREEYADEKNTFTTVYSITREEYLKMKEG